MKVQLARCAICDEPICIEIPSDPGEADITALTREFNALAEEHLRTHPKAVLARFWLRRFLDDIPPTDRAVATRMIYSELLSLWGDQDRRGTYTIDEALGTTCVYRLWLDANRCSDSLCRHAEVLPDPITEDTTSDGLVSNARLVGLIVPPPPWNGTVREWRQLVAAVTANCTCTSANAGSAPCPAHRMLANATCFNRVLFGRRMAERFEREEFAGSDPNPITSAGQPATA